MGINISAWEIKGIEEISESYPDNLYKYFKKEKIPYWDTCRYSGDKDFWMNEKLEWDTRYEGDDGKNFEDSYHRPKDIGKAIDWINKNIDYEGNKPRWITLLKDMETNSNIWLSCSY